MLPDGVLSSTPVRGAMVSPDNLVTSPRRDYERGGVAIGDASKGLSVRDWSAWIVGDDIWIGPVGEPGQVYLHAPGVTEVALAFDQAMRPHIAYVAAGQAAFYWYDTAAGQFTTMALEGVTTPRLALDEHRAQHIAASDVILAYVRAGNLYFRQQRDRFQIEYLLAETVRAGGRVGLLVAMGMSSRNRLQFVVR